MMLRPLWEKPCEALFPGAPVIMSLEGHVQEDCYRMYVHRCCIA